ncbi:helix-turn-helix transcriptional regulator [Methylobacterium phyllosphaerae]
MSIIANELGIIIEQIGDFKSEGRGLLKLLLGRTATRFRLDSEDWAVIRRHDELPLVLQAMLIPESVPSDAQTALILLDLAVTPKISLRKLEQIFELTPAEARLAALIVAGATPVEAAELQGLSVSTVRSHLSSIFFKTHTTRQSEFIALASRLSILA